jgi:NADPH:quinone reductase-like Zn-dependent oxidoreductase
MKAVGYTTPGALDRVDALLDLDLPVPSPGPLDLLVRVKAISVNPVDVKLRGGAAPPREGKSAGLRCRRCGRGGG